MSVEMGHLLADDPHGGGLSGLQPPLDEPMAAGFADFDFADAALSACDRSLGTGVETAAAAVAEFGEHEQLAFHDGERVEGAELRAAAAEGAGVGVGLGDHHVDGGGLVDGGGEEEVAVGLFGVGVRELGVGDREREGEGDGGLAGAALAACDDDLHGLPARRPPCPRPKWPATEGPAAGRRVPRVKASTASRITPETLV